MSIPPVIIPEYQFSDADGHPYAGGTLATYIPATSTPKTTWLDPSQTAANTNPVILDAAGRCILYGDGEYRLILRDAAGNLVWDIQATTLVSAAMAPVIAAPTIEDARTLLGIEGGSIADEAAIRAAADTAETNARIAADNAEATARANADTTLQSHIDAEAAARAAEDAHLQSGIDALTPGGGAVIVQGGLGTVSTSLPTPGRVHITFPTAFPTACTAVVVTAADSIWIGAIPSLGVTWIVSAISSSGADIGGYYVGSPSDWLPVPATFYWIAIGH